MNAVSQKVVASTVLVAIPDEWGILVGQLLEQHDYSVLMASSQDEARALLQSHSLSGAVIISDWALTSDDGETIGLMEIARGKVATVCLITP
jgi:DNA-binding response OmpR family regulator